MPYEIDIKSNPMYACVHEGGGLIVVNTFSITCIHSKFVRFSNNDDVGNALVAFVGLAIVAVVDGKLTAVHGLLYYL